MIGCEGMFFVLLTQLLVTASEPGSPSPSLEKAKRSYEEVQYEKCVDLTDLAVDETNDPVQRVEIDLYAGLCQFNLGESDEASEHFRRALKRDHQAKLPPFSPPKAVALFQSIAARVTPSPKPTDTTPPDDSPRRTTLAPSPKSKDVEEAFTPAKPTRFPFATTTLGTAAVVGAGIGTGLYLHARSLAIQANQEQFTEPANALGNRARSLQAASFASFGAAGAAAITAVVVYFLIEKPAAGESSEVR
ncbi:MAG: tetratricopeptide repeat protein [Myxococcaceae bacterium]